MTGVLRDRLHTPRHRTAARHRRSTVIGGSLVGIGGLVGGIWMILAPPSAPTGPASPVHGFSVSEGEARVIAKRDDRLQPPLDHQAISVPAYGIAGPIRAVALGRDGVLEPPPGTVDVGLWNRGAGLDSPTGTTLLVGHVTYGAEGDGVFFDLARVRPGTVVETASASGPTRRWVVTSLREYRKSALPSSVFAGVAGSRHLALITCGGPVVTLPDGSRSYLSNVVVMATPA